MKSKTFSFKRKNDLKREEIIGFLPLWSGVVSRQRADSLVKVLTDTSKFWRKYGVPSLSAADPYYNPTGYWNGPVWVEWNFLIEEGLLKYGYKDLANELVNKVASGMIAQLKKDHEFWEFYNPDREWAGYHRSYIWDGLISRMLMDVIK
jgi:Glycogen debranching enzyme